jgi:hypothetical protein
MVFQLMKLSKNFAVLNFIISVPSKSKSAGLSVPGATAGLSVLGILVLVLIVLVVCLVWR